MVILKSLSASYIINGDGSTISSVQLTTPNNVDNYAERALPAVVAGQLYLFGGVAGDNRKVRLIFFIFKTKYFFRSPDLMNVLLSNFNTNSILTCILVQPLFQFPTTAKVKNVSYFIKIKF